MGGMREGLLDETCNVLWERFRGRSRNILHSEQFSFLRIIVPKTGLGDVYINLFVIFYFEGSESEKLGYCGSRMMYILELFRFILRG